MTQVGGRESCKLCLQEHCSPIATCTVLHSPACSRAERVRCASKNGVYYSLISDCIESIISRRLLVRGHSRTVVFNRSRLGICSQGHLLRRRYIEDLVAQNVLAVNACQEVIS